MPNWFSKNLNNKSKKTSRYQISVIADVFINKHSEDIDNTIESQAASMMAKDYLLKEENVETNIDGVLFSGHIKCHTFSSPEKIGEY
jgi:hypothetical protein